MAKQFKKVPFVELDTHKELHAVVAKMVDVVTSEYKAVKKRLQDLEKLPDSLEKLAEQTEQKIRQQELDKIMSKFKGIIAQAQRKFLLVTIKPGDN